ncbi:TPA: DUF211 domain-containing protein [Candidatus Woesearchaeota archaeon]|nr:hypothetical protein QT06_C0001G1176 [archaeon GW2011_AR15]MBS3104354.1 DUF211 domain-containing protein [Candidatus Woesearchaeota archaeon]HIH40862.1 DUF211 domain-containing protein [Candidatus Woesearchaeota archaeon]
MSKIRLLVLDVLKPHEPSIMRIATALSDLEGVDGADITVYEIDSKVENVKVTLQGKDIDFAQVKEIMEENGASIHSIDKVSTGAVIVEEAHTHQDT